MEKRLLSPSEVLLLSRLSDLYASLHEKSCPFFLVFRFSAGAQELVRATFKLPPSAQTIFWSLDPFSLGYATATTLLLSLCRLQESSSGGVILRADPVVLICEELKFWLASHFTSLHGSSPAERLTRLDYLRGVRGLIAEPIPSLALPALDECVVAIQAVLEAELQEQRVAALADKSVTTLCSLLDSLRSIGCCGALFLFYVFRDRKFSEKTVPHDLDSADSKSELGKAMESQSGQWLLCLLKALPFQILLSADSKTPPTSSLNPFLSSLPPADTKSSSVQEVDKGVQRAIAPSIWTTPCDALSDLAEIGGILPFFRRSPELMNHFLGFHGWLFELARTFSFLHWMFRFQVSFQHPLLTALIQSLRTVLHRLQHDFKALCAKATVFDEAINAISQRKGSAVVPLWSLLASHIQDDIACCEMSIVAHQPDSSLSPLPREIVVQTELLCSRLDRLADLTRSPETLNVRQRARELDYSAGQANRYAEQAYGHMAGGNPSEAVHCFSLAIELNPSAPELSISRAEAADLQAYSTGGHDRHYREMCLQYQDLTDERKLEEIASFLSSTPFCWSVRRVELTHDGLTSMGVFSLATGLLRCSGLTHLSLAHNKLDDEGAVALAQLLVFTEDRLLPKLEHLNLASNLITNRGIIALAGALGANTTLMHLDMSGNAIEDLGLEAFTEAILANAKCGLEIVMLGENKFGEDGVCALTKMVREKEVFVDVSLGYSEKGDPPAGVSCSHNAWLELEGILAERRQRGRRPSITEFARKGPPFEFAAPQDLAVFARLQALFLSACNEESELQENEQQLSSKLELPPFTSASNIWPLLEPCKRLQRTLSLADNTNSLIKFQLEEVDGYESARARFFRSSVSAKYPLHDKVSVVLREHSEWLTRLWRWDRISASWLLSQHDNPLIETLSSRIRYLRSLVRESSKLSLSQSFCELITQLSNQLEASKAYFVIDRQLSQISLGFEKMLRLSRFILHHSFIFLSYCHVAFGGTRSDAANVLNSLASAPHADMSHILSGIYLHSPTPSNSYLSLCHVLALLNCSFSLALFPSPSTSCQSLRPARPPSQSTTGSCDSSSSSSPESVSAPLLETVTFKFGTTQAQKRQVLPPRVLHTSGPLFAFGEPVMAYFKSVDEPLPAVVVKCNNNGTYHVRFEDGESDFRCSEQCMMTRDWQPKVRAQPDLLIWMEPVQTKSKTKSHIFSMYKAVELDEFSGFVLQKRKKDAGETHRAFARIVSSATYPSWEVAYSDSLEDARSRHWKYIKELAALIPQNTTKEERADWIVNHIKLLINPPLTTSPLESKQALSWLSRAKPTNVNLMSTQNLLSATSGEQTELLEKSDVQNFLQEWCSHHNVPDVDGSVRDFWDKFACESDGRILRKSLVNFLTTPIPIAIRAPPPPPPNSRSMVQIEAPSEVKLNLDPHFERLHGLIASLLPLLFVLSADITSSEWLHSTMNQSLSTLLQWASLTCQLTLNCIKANESAFESYEKAISLTNMASSDVRPPPLLTKSLLANFSDTIKHMHALRDSVIELRAQDLLLVEPEPLSPRAVEWLGTATEALKNVSDFVPRHLAASLTSSGEPSCTCSLSLQSTALPLSRDLILPAQDLNLTQIFPPELPATPTPRSAVAPQLPVAPPPPLPSTAKEVKPPTPRAAPVAPSRRVVSVFLPKGMSSTQTKLQVISTDSAKVLKIKLLAKFGASQLSASDYVMVGQLGEIPDDANLGTGDSFSLQLKGSRDVARSSRPSVSIAPDKIMEAAQYVTQAEAALRAGNESAAREFFELQRMCLADAEVVTPTSRVEELRQVHRELKTQEMLALQYQRDAERYMKAGLSQSAVNNYDLQRDALQRIEDLRKQLRELKGELEVTVFTGQAPSTRGVLDVLQAQRRSQPNKGAASAALVFNLELGFLTLAVAEGKTLLEGLDSHAGIRRLSLHCSNVGDSGVCALADLWAQAVKNSPLQQSLVHLDLNSNEIGPCGADAIAHILTTNQVLEYLDLSCNQLGKAGCLALIRALEDNPVSGLRILRLGATGADDSIAQAVLRCLSYNFSLSEVSLHGNQVSDSLLERIAVKLQRPRSSLARETHAAQWRAFRDEYLALPLGSFVASVNLLLSDFLDSDEQEKGSLRLVVGFSLLPAKLKQVALSLKPKTGAGRFVDHTSNSVVVLYQGLLSAISFAMKVARVCFRQQEQLPSPQQARASPVAMDPFTSLFDQSPLQEIQDWFEALVVTSGALRARLWWHLDEALSLADRNPSLIKLSLSLLSVTLASFLNNEDYKADHAIASPFLPATRLPPGTEQQLRQLKAGQRGVLDLLFAPEESVGLSPAIESFLRTSMAKRFSNATAFNDSDAAGLADWLNSKLPQTSREDGAKVIAGLRELVDDLAVVHDSLRPCFGSYDILALYFSEYQRLIKLTLQSHFPPKGLEAGSAVALLKFLDWTDNELADSLEQDMGVWDFFSPEVDAYYSAYEAQSQVKVLSWLDNVIQLDLTSDETKQCVMDEDCVFTNTPTDAFNTLDRYINSFLELLPARCLTEVRVEALVNGLTKAIGHIHTRLKNALEVGVEYARGDELEDVVVVWLKGGYRKSYRYIIAQVNNLVRFESHIEDLKDGFSKRLKALGVVAVQDRLLEQIDDCSELFGDVAAAGVDVLVHSIQLRVSACLQHQFTSKWLHQMAEEDGAKDQPKEPLSKVDFEDTELVDLLADLIGTVGCGFARRAYLAELLKRVFRATVMEYFEVFLLSNLPLGSRASAVFDAMRTQLAGLGLLFEEYSEHIPPKVLQQDIRYGSGPDSKQSEDEVLSLLRAVVTCELDFLPAHFSALHSKFSQPRFIDRGLPPIFCVHALLAMRPDLNFHERCDHLHAFELKHPFEPVTLRCVKDAELAAFLSSDSAVRSKQVKHKLEGAKRDVGLQLERAKGLARSKLKEANAVAKERVQKFKDKRQQAKLEEGESAAWGAAKEEGAKKLAQAKEKLKLWRRK